MSRSVAVVAAIVALAVAFAAPARADGPYRVTLAAFDSSHFPVIRLTATVSDASGRGIAALGASDFLVVEDGTPQRATVEPASNAAPLTLAVVLDTSGSMAGRPQAGAKKAIAT